jgi:hypothetical protein
MACPPADIDRRKQPHLSGEGGEGAMIRKRLGSGVLEYIVVVVLVVSILAVVVYTVLFNGALKGTAVGTWISNMSVPGA